jgi:hypothetical protein
MHEIVQVAVPADDLGAGPQHQVEGIAENDLRAALDEFLRRHRLDRAVGADRHERRRFDAAALELQPRPSRPAGAFQQREFHRSARALMNIASP